MKIGLIIKAKRKAVSELERRGYEKNNSLARDHYFTEISRLEKQISHLEYFLFLNKKN